MDKKIYMVSINALLHNDVMRFFIDTFNDWYIAKQWNFNLVFIVTELPFKTIHNRIKTMVPNGSTFFCAEINPKSFTGIMCKDFWQWLAKSVKSIKSVNIKSE